MTERISSAAAAEERPATEVEIFEANVQTADSDTLIAMLHREKQSFMVNLLNGDIDPAGENARRAKIIENRLINGNLYMSGTYTHRQ